MSGVVPGTADAFQKKTPGGSPAFGETTMTKHNVVDRSLFNITTTRDHTSTIRNGQTTISDALDVCEPVSTVQPATGYDFPYIDSKGPFVRLVQRRRNPLDAVTSCCVTVSPFFANELLAKNHPLNRRSNAYKDYAKTLKRFGQDAWKLSASIKLGPDLTLGDGQNRLRAIEMTGVPVRMLIDVYHDATMFEGCMLTIDLGRRRSPGDALVMAGECEPEVARMSGSIIKAMCAIDSSLEKNPIQVDNIRIMRSFGSSIEWATKLTGAGKAHIRAAFAIAHRASPEKGSRFAIRTLEKVGLEDGSAALMAAQRLADMNAQRTAAGKLDAMKQLLELAYRYIHDKAAPGRSLRVTDAAMAYFFGTDDNERPCVR